MCSREISKVGLSAGNAAVSDGLSQITSRVTRRRPSDSPCPHRPKPPLGCTRWLRARRVPAPTAAVPMPAQHRPPSAGPPSIVTGCSTTANLAAAARHASRCDAPVPAAMGSASSGVSWQKNGGRKMGNLQRIRTAAALFFCPYPPARYTEPAPDCPSSALAPASSTLDAAGERPTRHPQTALCRWTVTTTGHAGGASDPTIIPDANAASRAPVCYPTTKL